MTTSSRSTAFTDAIVAFCNSLDIKIRSGTVTYRQIHEALRSYPDFYDAWDDWNVEDGDVVPGRGPARPAGSTAVETSAVLA